MARRNQSANTGMLIAIVIVTIIAGSAIFVAYDLGNRLEKSDVALKKAKTEAAGFEQDLREEKNKRAEEGRYVFGGNTNDLRSLELWMVEKFADRIDPKLTTIEDKLKFIRKEKIVVTDYDIPDKDFATFKTELAARYDENVERLQQEIQSLTTRKDELEENLQNEITQLQQTIDENNVEIGRLNQEKEEISENHSSEIEILNQRINESRNRMRVMARDHNIELSRLEIENEQLRNKIDEKSRSVKGQLVPDGEVINVNSSIHTSTAYINLGRHDKITRGMRFEVFQWSHAGTQRKKGEVIVREVLAHTSKVGIIMLEDPMDPIVEGDQIANIVYDAKDKRSFALIGSFENFTKDELKRLIERDGGTVSELVHAQLDHVVVGKFSDLEDDPENLRFQRANDLHIPFLNENEIQRFLRDYSGVRSTLEEGEVDTLYTEDVPVQ